MPHYETSARVVLSSHGTKDDEKKVFAAYTAELRQVRTVIRPPIVLHLPAPHLPSRRVHTQQLALEEFFTGSSLTPTGPYVIAGGHVCTRDGHNTRVSRNTVYLPWPCSCMARWTPTRHGLVPTLAPWLPAPATSPMPSTQPQQPECVLGSVA